MLIGGCLAIALYLNAALDKREERRLEREQENRR